MASVDRPKEGDDGERLSPSDLTCKGCGHQWTTTTLLGGTHEQWVAWLESQQCPMCNRNYHLEHVRHREPEEYLTLPPAYQRPKPPQ